MALPQPLSPLLRRLALRALLVGLLGALLAAAPGCYFMRAPRAPMRALYFQADAHTRRSCLMVLFPGMIDEADSYQRHGFVSDVFDEGDRCDVVSLDAHFRYYFERNLRDRVADDILMSARLRGYEEIWLVGISMGGLGALMTAVDHPEQVDGVLLMSPFLGERSVIEEVRDAGGLREWQPAERDPYALEDDYTVEIWTWLRSYALHPDRMPPLYLGVGSEDQLQPACEVLAEVLPEDRVVTIEGGSHNWQTWRRIWRTWLPDAPWGYGGHDPAPARASRESVIPQM